LSSRTLILMASPILGRGPAPTYVTVAGHGTAPTVFVVRRTGQAWATSTS